MPNRIGSTKIEKMIARALLSEHASGVSWRQISKRFETLKPGTLCRIAKSDGNYFPSHLKMKTYENLFDLSSAELLWCLQNRTEMK